MELKVQQCTCQTCRWLERLLGCVEESLNCCLWLGPTFCTSKNLRLITSWSLGVEPMHFWDFVPYLFHGANNPSITMQNKTPSLPMQLYEMAVSWNQTYSSCDAQKVLEDKDIGRRQHFMVHGRGIASLWLRECPGHAYCGRVACLKAGSRFRRCQITAMWTRRRISPTYTHTHPFTTCLTTTRASRASTPPFC